MIEINLLPEDRRKKMERFKRLDLSELKIEHTAVFGMIGAVFGVLLIIQIALVIAGWAVKANVVAREKDYSALLTQKKEADSLKSQIDMVNKKVRAIDELMVNRFSWAKKLADLNNAIIPGVWLTELDYEERGAGQAVVRRPDGRMKTVLPKAPPVRCLTLNGYALNANDEGNAIIGKFIKSLKNSAGFYEDFKDIQLDYSKAEKFKDQPVDNFKITCFFKENAK